MSDCVSRSRVKDVDRTCAIKNARLVTPLFGEG